MRNRWFRLMCFSVCLLLVPLAQGQNLIYENDFETGDLSSWSLFRPVNLVFIHSPARGFQTSEEFVDVAGVVYGSAIVKVNGLMATVDGNTFSLQGLPLIEGVNDITAIAGPAQRTITILRDSIGPEVIITEPADNSGVMIGSVIVAGTVSEAVPVLVNGREAVLNGLDFSVTVDLREGMNTVFAEASDALGNVGSAAVSVLLDTSPPRVSITRPLPGEVLAAGTTTVGGNIHDAAAGIVNLGECTLKVNGVEAEVSNGSWVAFDVPVVAGQGTIVAVATDRLGNRGSAVTEIFGNADPAAQIRAISGDGQTARANLPIGDPLVVQVSDNAENPVAGVEVSFSVARSNGRLGNGGRQQVVTTDGDGMASVTLTLGSRSGGGSDRVEARAEGILGTATFYASAAPSEERRMAVSLGASQRALAGTLAREPLLVLVTDENGNPVVGESVTFEVSRGSGLVNGSVMTEVTTDDDGHAAVLLAVGGEIGVRTQQVEASVAKAPDPARFYATVVAAGSLRSGSTTVSGVVLNNENHPVVGAEVSLAESDPLILTLTDAEGRFTLAGAGSGPALLHVEGATAGPYPSLEFDLNLLPGVDNPMGRPIFVPTVDTDGIAMANPNTDVVSTRADTPGFSLTIPAGAATFADGSKLGQVQVIPVNRDKIPMVPPDGTDSRLAISIQPGSVSFDPPAILRLPNTEGRQAGEVIDLHSFDHDVGAFIPMGTLKVSEDGTFLESEFGQGVVKGGWHRVPPTPPTRLTIGTLINTLEFCEETAGGVVCHLCRVLSGVCDCTQIVGYSSGNEPETPDFDCFLFPANGGHPELPCRIADIDPMLWPGNTLMAGETAIINALTNIGVMGVTQIYKNPGDACVRRYEDPSPFHPALGPNSPGECRMPALNNPFGFPVCCPIGHWDATNDVCCDHPVTGGIC